MSDDEVIRFEITDYDLDNEFNFTRNRKAKKEHQIYGMCIIYTLFPSDKCRAIIVPITYVYST